LKRFFAIKGELLLRHCALLADNTRFIRAAVTARPAHPCRRVPAFISVFPMRCAPGEPFKKLTPARRAPSF
jgi:hypothetical protein